MKSKVKRRRGFSQMYDGKLDQNIESVVTKIIERKMQGSRVDLNFIARNISNQPYKNSRHDFLGLMQPRPSDNGFTFGTTSGQIFAVLAQSIQKAMLRNL
jgi:hypothetical protein